MKARTALVTGITGQDGSYLAELLLEKGYQVLDTQLLAVHALKTAHPAVTQPSPSP